MEVREILIANTKTQKRTKLNTNATTLGELKEVMRGADIDFEGMTFTEGISKTQLLEDNTQLPQNLMYKGQTTNNLVILLTNTKKNIASGIFAGDRKTAYSIIKENNLQDKVKDTFGRNFTQVSTAELANFIEQNIEDKVEEKSNEIEVSSEEKESDSAIDETLEQTPSETSSVNRAIHDFISDNIAHDIFNLIYNLTLIGGLNATSLSYLIEATNRLISSEPSEPVSTTDGTITDDDIDDMLNDLDL